MLEYVTYVQRSTAANSGFKYLCLCQGYSYILDGVNQTNLG